MSVGALVDALKQNALNVVNSTDPVRVLFGTVESESPLSIRIDQKTVITSDFLVLCREVTDYDVEMTVNHQVEKMSGGGGHPSFTSHIHQYKGRKVFKVHKGLKAGEKVLLLAMQGGQTFTVLDRVV